MTESPTMEHEYLTADEVAARYRVHRATIYRKAKSGELPAEYIGRTPRFKVADLEAHFRSQQLTRQGVVPMRRFQRG